MRVLADTSAVIDPAGFDWPEEAEIAISAVTLAELGFGVVAARDELARARRTMVLQRARVAFEALPVDESVAEAYVVAATATRVDGRSPRPRALDLLIVATAIAHGLPLYTRDVADALPLRHLVDLRGAARLPSWERSSSD